MGASPDVLTLIDAIVALVACEAALLALARGAFGVGPRMASSTANCAAGAALLLALRVAMAGASFPVIALWLAAALFAHLADLVLRFRDAPSGAGAASSSLQPEHSRV